MNERDLIQEYNEKLKECELLIQENQKTARQLQLALKAVEQLQQGLKQLIELNS